ncbi:MAG: endonuclease III, partial [Alphaproteobacteria bacterium]|nr:endonuclease III [Alphaproteobacteria bacterium]
YGSAQRVPMELAESLAAADERINVRIQRAIQRLPAKARTLIRLRYYRRFSLREIGELVQADPRTVKKRLDVSLDALQSLPGVGRKTANVWLNCALGVPTIAVDTHVFRVANRLGLCKTSTADATADALEKIVPAEYKLHAHHWLILHGRYTCVARKPKCSECILRDLCEFKGKAV